MREDRAARAAGQETPMSVVSGTGQLAMHRPPRSGRTESEPGPDEALQDVVSDIGMKPGDSPESAPGTDFLFQQGSLSHYFNDIVLSRVLNEVITLLHT